LIEDGLAPGLSLYHPVLALREVSRDPSFRWKVDLSDGRSIGAVDVQREFLAKSKAAYAGQDDQTDWVLREWESILDGLERDPMALDDRIDWVAKRKIVEQYREEEGLDWSDDALHSVDLEYHNIDPEASLFHAWQAMGKTGRIVSDLDVLAAMTDPPQDTRAKGRSRLVEQVLKRKRPGFYLFDWSGVALDRNRYFEMPDPFETYDVPLDQWGRAEEA
jgi:proteasome accessory factor A